MTNHKYNIMQSGLVFRTYIPQGSALTKHRPHTQVAASLHKLVEKEADLIHAEALHLVRNLHCARITVTAGFFQACRPEKRKR